MTICISLSEAVVNAMTRNNGESYFDLWFQRVKVQNGGDPAMAAAGWNKKLSIAVRALSRLCLLRHDKIGRLQHGVERDPTPAACRKQSARAIRQGEGINTQRLPCREILPPAKGSRTSPNSTLLMHQVFMLGPSRGGGISHSNPNIP